jgi:hypothetical protein
VTAKDSEISALFGVSDTDAVEDGQVERRRQRSYRSRIDKHEGYYVGSG